MDNIMISNTTQDLELIQLLLQQYFSADSLYSRFFCPQSSISQGLCSIGTYFDSVKVQYQQCPLNSSSPVISNTIQNCTCNPGFTWKIGETCSPCGEGAFKSGGGGTNCSGCPHGAFCNSATAVPTQCPINTYCGTGVREPTSCPQFSTSLTAAGSIWDCECSAGFAMVRGVCVVCSYST